VDAVDAVVLRVGDVDVAGGVDRDARRLPERGDGGGGAVHRRGVHAVPVDDGRDAARAVDQAHAVAVVLGDVDARGADGEAGRTVEEGLGGRPAVARAVAVAHERAGRIGRGVVSADPGVVGGGDDDGAPRAERDARV